MADVPYRFYLALREVRYGPGRTTPLGRWLTDDHMSTAGSIVTDVAKRGSAKFVGGVQARPDVMPEVSYVVWQDRGGGWAEAGRMGGADLRRMWANIVDSAQYHKTCVLPVGILPEGAEAVPKGARRFDPYYSMWVLPDGAPWWSSIDYARADVERWKALETRQVAQLANISDAFGFAKGPKRELAQTRKYIAEAKAWIRAQGAR